MRSILLSPTRPSDGSLGSKPLLSRVGGHAGCSPLATAGGVVDRQHLQENLAKIRLKDAQTLLGRKRWSGVYYLSGYVVECA